MTRFQWVALMTILVVLAVLSTSVHAETDPAEKGVKGFWVEEAALDLGSIPAGTDAVGTYVFHNDTAKEVKIIKAKPS